MEEYICWNKIFETSEKCWETSLDLPSEFQSHWISELQSSEYLDWDCNEKWLWGSGILTRSFFDVTFLIRTLILKLVPVMSQRIQWNKTYFSLSDKETSSILQSSARDVNQGPWNRHRVRHKLRSLLTSLSHKMEHGSLPGCWHKIVCPQPRWLEFTFPNPYHLKVRWG